MNQVINKLLANRERWLDVEPGKRVKIRRPAETRMPRLLGMDPVEVACQHVTGWEGVTMADLLGANQEAPDPVPFDQELWRVVVEDKMDWVLTIHNAIAEDTRVFLEKKAEAAKNSQPS